MNPNETKKQYTFIKTSGRWFPLLDKNTIDERGVGFVSKKAVRAWVTERAGMAGEKISVSFR